METKAFDRFTQITAQYAPKQNSLQNDKSTTQTVAEPPVVVIGITEADIQTQKSWPLSDQVFADLLAQLQKHSPRVIGLDIYRDIPHQPGSAALAKQLQQDNIITITKLDDLGAGEVPSPLQVPENRVGFNDFVADSDGVIRRNFMFGALGNKQLYAFSLRLVEHFIAQDGLTITPAQDAIIIGNTRIKRMTSTAGGYQTADATGYQSILRYFPPDDVARQISLSQVLSGDFDPSWVKDKIVLIGTTAPSQKDLFYTPFSSTDQNEPLTAGVMVHAQMTRQLLSAATGERALFSVLPQWGEWLWIGLWGISGGLLIWRCARPHMVLVVTAAGLIGLSAFTGLLFFQAIWLPFVAPALAFTLTGVALLVYKEFRKTFYDSITGLPNRTLFTQDLQKYLKRHPHQSAAVILVNIDKFKLFNENFGLNVGDRLLQLMSKRLRQHLPTTAKVARIAGDEFVVLLQNISEEKDACAIAELLTQQMAVPITLEEQKLFPTVSAGISLHTGQPKKTIRNRREAIQAPNSPAIKTQQQSQTPTPPNEALTAEDLLQNAQTAMSRAKSKGRGRCEVFAADMRTQISNRLWMEADLREAVENQEFLLYYQPLICMRTMTVAGFEALIRWQHPHKGMISPGEFIPLTEDTGLIIPIGQWVLEVACNQAELWRQQFPAHPPFISVNLSGRQFSQQDLVQQIDRILTESGLERSALKLELTESVVMDDVEASIDVLLQLKALGLQLGIDDFGTGYSSLSYLHRFPIDTLKVDRSFVMEMESKGGTAELVKTIIALGHNLGMNVVAEGIETESQSQLLSALQCEYGQGYLFAKPLPAQAAEALLSEAPSWKSKTSAA